MMLRATFALLLVLLIIQETNSGAAQPTTGMVYGPAGSSCGAYSASPPLPETSIRVHYLIWVEGYISGAATVLSSRESIELANTDPAGIEAWMNKYCSNHPIDSLQLAATNLVLELVAKRNP
jgi:hypothetical protein